MELLLNYFLVPISRFLSISQARNLEIIFYSSLNYTLSVKSCTFILSSPAKSLSPWSTTPVLLPLLNWFLHTTAILFFLKYNVNHVTGSQELNQGSHSAYQVQTLLPASQVPYKLSAPQRWNHTPRAISHRGHPPHSFPWGLWNGECVQKWEEEAMRLHPLKLLLFSQQSTLEQNNVNSKRARIMSAIPTVFYS